MKTSPASNISNDIFADYANQTKTTAFSQPGWQIAIWAITYLSMVIVSVVGNGTVIWIILSHRRMRTVTNYFIVNLALSDLLMTALNTVFNFIYASHNVWYFGKGFCQFINFLPITAMFVSIYSMTAVAVERYMAIIYPFKRKLSAGNTKVIIGIIWLVACGLAFPQFFYAQIIIDEGTPKCIIIWPGNSEHRRLTYHISVIVLVYLLPLTVMFIAYREIGLTLWNNAVPGDHANIVYYHHQINAKKKRIVSFPCTSTPVWKRELFVNVCIISPCLFFNFYLFILEIYTFLNKFAIQSYIYQAHIVFSLSILHTHIIYLLLPLT
uniref:Tachykinin receptor 2 n=1 Tax=Anolis carolinensis TaxID=28377 RepID=H9GEZ6_ANOCA